MFLRISLVRCCSQAWGTPNSTAPQALQKPHSTCFQFWGKVLAKLVARCVSCTVSCRRHGSPSMNAQAHGSSHLVSCRVLAQVHLAFACIVLIDECVSVKLPSRTSVLLKVSAAAGFSLSNSNPSLRLASAGCGHRLNLGWQWLCRLPAARSMKFDCLRV